MEGLSGLELEAGHRRRGRRRRRRRNQLHRSERLDLDERTRGWPATVGSNGSSIPMPILADNISAVSDGAIVARRAWLGGGGMLNTLTVEALRQSLRRHQGKWKRRLHATEDRSAPPKSGVSIRRPNRPRFSPRLRPLDLDLLKSIGRGGTRTPCALMEGPWGPHAGRSLGGREARSSDGSALRAFRLFGPLPVLNAFVRTLRAPSGSAQALTIGRVSILMSSLVSWCINCVEIVGRSFQILVHLRGTIL